MSGERRAVCADGGADDDAAARKADIPIVQLNPGGVLNWKYEGECAARAAGFAYTVVRCTGGRVGPRLRLLPAAAHGGVPWPLHARGD